MTPTFVAAALTSAAASSTGSPVTVALPAGIAAGDLAILAVSTNGGTFPTVTVPTGWSQVSTGIGGPTTLLYKILSSADVTAGSVAVTYSTTNTANRFVVTAWRGCDPVTPIRAFASTTAFSGAPTSTPTAPTASGAVAGDLVVRIIQAAASTAKTAMNWPGGVTEDYDSSVVTGTTASAEIAEAEAVQATSGTTGTVAASSVLVSDGTTAQTVWGFWRTLVLAPAAASAPVNTVAPAVTGTAKVGQTLTSDTGTWTNSPTGFARQWLRDGSTTGMSGATGTTYVVTSADAGHAITCQVTATNGAGSSSPAVSNSLAIPGVPVNTSIPVITTDGTPATGETITCSSGSWTNSPDTYSYQWFRGASPITGATASSYLLAVTDEGANITCQVTASNGSSATAASAAIVPAVTAAISDASFLNYYSGGVGNTDPSLSIGGARGGTYPGGLSALFADIAGSVAQAGGTFYRGIYIRNTHTISSAAAMKAYVAQQFAHTGLQVAVGVDSSAAANAPLPHLASQTTAPSGVTFTTTTDPTSGQDFGTLTPGDYRGLWVRLAVTAGTTAIAEDDAQARVEGSAA